MPNNLHSVLMIRPSSFRHNHETAKNNYFQNQNFNLNNNIVLKNALLEFDNLVSKIKDCGIILINWDYLNFRTIFFCHHLPWNYIRMMF